MIIILRAYAEAATIPLTLFKAGADTFATGSDWVPATGDVKVSIDGGAQANITSLPVFTNGQWFVSLSAAEATGKRVMVTIEDAAVVSESILIETFGHANSQWPSLGGAMLEAIYNSTVWGAGLLPQVG